MSQVTEAVRRAKVRDGYKCQWGGCKKTKGYMYIHGHHCLTQGRYPHYATDSGIIITYCLYHHYMWHKYNYKHRKYEVDRIACERLWNVVMNLMEQKIRVTPGRANMTDEEYDLFWT